MTAAGRTPGPSPTPLRLAREATELVLRADADAGQPTLRQATVPSLSVPTLRLRRSEEDAVTAPSVTSLLKEARLAVIAAYGPCCANAAAIVVAWARRLAETNPMPFATRIRLLAELARLGTTQPVVEGPSGPAGEGGAVPTHEATLIGAANRPQTT